MKKIDKSKLKNIKLVNTNEFYSKENQRVLRENIDQMERTGGTIHDINLDD